MNEVLKDLDSRGHDEQDSENDEERRHGLLISQICTDRFCFLGLLGVGGLSRAQFLRCLVHLAFLLKHHAQIVVA